MTKNRIFMQNLNRKQTINGKRFCELQEEGKLMFDMYKPKTAPADSKVLRVDVKWVKTVDKPENVKHFLSPRAFWQWIDDVEIDQETVVFI